MIRIRNTGDRKRTYNSRRKWGGGRMCEYMTGGRLNKRIDSWNWNCKKGEEMNSSALVTGMQQPAGEEWDRAIAQDRRGQG
jgi:hypothetical protein